MMKFKCNKCFNSCTLRFDDGDDPIFCPWDSNVPAEWKEIEDITISHSNLEKIEKLIEEIIKEEGD